MMLILLGFALLWVAAIILGVLIKALAWLAITGLILFVGTAITAAVLAKRNH